MIRFLLSLVLAALPYPALADSWMPPSPHAIVSENADIVVRVEPGFSIEDGSEAKPAHCRIFRYSAEKKSYELLREHNLVNDILPGSIVVPDDASFLVTFDDYMGIGTSENTVVVYDSTGQVLKRWTLKDIFTEAEIEELPHSTMSILWRGSVGVMLMSQHEVYISPAESRFQRDKNKKFKGFMLDIKSLTIREDPRWRQSQ